MRARAWCLCLLALAAAGCDDGDDARAAVAAAAPRIDPVRVRQVIEQSNTRFAQHLSRGQAATASEIYAEDARLLAPNTDIIEGRDAIRAFWEGAVEHLGLRDVRLTTVDVEFAGERAYEVGTYQFTMQFPDEAEPFTDRGKYLVVWEQGEDGRWRWATDIWNTSLPPSRTIELADRGPRPAPPPPVEQRPRLLGRPAQQP